MLTELLFQLANAFVLPFWTLMIIAPNWSVTRKLLASPLPFAVPLALAYIVLVAGGLNAESLQSMSNPQLADIARFLGTPQGAAAGWVHYLVIDLFVGRWIYLEGQRTGVWTIHSLVLCLFAGPVGLLSHLLTAQFAPARKAADA